MLHPEARQELIARNAEERRKKRLERFASAPAYEWLLLLRKEDSNEKEFRRFRGTLTQAYERREHAMATGKYSVAWLIEKGKVLV